MSDRTKIEWCDSTFNPWIGCTKVSPACDHCYAEVERASVALKVKWGAGQTRYRTAKANWKQPERWDKDIFLRCEGCGYRGPEKAFESGCPGDCGNYEGTSCTRQRVFSASLGDWLDSEAPIEWLVDFLDLVRRTPNLDWLLLTKRIGNWRKRLELALDYAKRHPDGSFEHPLVEWLGEWLGGMAIAPRNVWIGATVINQAEADRDVPKLLAVPARIRFLSIEPMLGPIRLDAYHDWLGRSPGGFFCPDCPEHGVGIDPAEHRGCLGEITDEQPYEGIDWVIAGGESGARARPSHPDWYRSLRDQCAAASVPFLFKQWGEWEPRTEWSGHLGGGRFETMVAIMSDGSECPHDLIPQNVGAHRMARIGKAKAGRLLDGVEHNGYPGPA